jgi:hypothetical protein
MTGAIGIGMLQLGDELTRPVTRFIELLCLMGR